MWFRKEFTTGVLNQHGFKGGGDKGLAGIYLSVSYFPASTMPANGSFSCFCFLHEQLPKREFCPNSVLEKENFFPSFLQISSQTQADSCEHLSEIFRGITGFKNLLPFCHNLHITTTIDIIMDFFLSLKTPVAPSVSGLTSLRYITGKTMVLMSPVSLQR